MALRDLPGISLMPIPEWSEPNHWLTCIVVDPRVSGANREQIRLALEAENIESRPLWKPMHLQPVRRDCPKFVNGISETLFQDGLCLPSGNGMTEEDLTRVIKAIRGVCGMGGSQ